MEEIIKLRTLIRETEDILSYIAANHRVFNGYDVLYNQVREWKHQLAEAEFKHYKFIRNQILSN